MGKIRSLSGHILEIISHIDQQRWDEACKALLDSDSASLCGLRIDSPFEIVRTFDEAVAFTRRRAMWYHSNKKLCLPLVAIGGKGFNSNDWKYPTDIPDLAKIIFPILLEEWIH